MHAERRIHILEKAFANEASFGTAVLAAFFARCSINADFTAHQFCGLCQRSAGERTGGAEKVVTAPVRPTSASYSAKKQRTGPGLPDLNRASKPVG